MKVIKIAQYLNDFKFEKIKLKTDLSIDEEKYIFSKYVKADFFICEMLESSVQKQIFYKKKSKKLCILDDLIDHIYEADYVFCCQTSLKKDIKNIEISNPKTNFFHGYKYFPFSEEITKFKKTNKFVVNKKINNVLVVLGGGNYSVAYLKIAKAINKTKDKIVTFVIPGENKYITSALMKINPNFKILNYQNNLFQLMHQSDLVITNAGYTKIEAAYINTPIIMIPVQWHQIHLAENFHKLTGAPYCKYMSLASSKDIHRCINYMEPFKIRKTISDKFKKTIKYDGKEEIYKILLKMKS